MLDDAAVDALRKAIAREGEAPLVGKSKTNPGVFPSRTGAYKGAIEECLAPENAFLEVVRETESGKTAKKWVVITLAGVDALVAATPPTERTKIWDEAASRFKGPLLECVVRRSRSESEELRLERTRLQAKQDELLQVGVEMLDAQLDALALEAKHVDATLERVETVRTELIDAAPQASHDDGRIVEATAERDLDFQRDICQELVFAWQDTDSDDVRDQLARVLLNVGLEQVEEAGVTVTYDGSVHIATDPVQVGERVEVVLPGWRLVNRRGRLLIARARVKKCSADSLSSSGVAQ